MTIYEYQIKTIHGMSYRKHVNTHKSWEDALNELGYDQEEMESMTSQEIKDACRKLGASSKYDEIYSNPDFIKLMLNDWNAIGFRLKREKVVNGHELNEYLRAYSVEMETLMSNLILEDKTCDWSTKTWTSKGKSYRFHLSKATLADLSI